GIYSARARAALVHVGQRPRTPDITVLQPLDAKTGRCDQIADRAVEVTSASEPLPDRCETILPPAHAGFRSTAVFHEQQHAADLQHAPHLAQGSARIRNAAQG